MSSEQEKSLHQECKTQQKERMNFIETEDAVKQFSGHLALNKVNIQAPQWSCRAM
jgi:hypothetical protein